MQQPKQNSRNIIQMLLIETPTSAIQKFIIWQNQAKQTAHTQYCHGKSPTRVPSTTQQTSTNKNGEIKDLKNQIKLLKQNKRQHDA